MVKCDDIALEALVDPENIDADDIDAHNPDVARHVESCTQCQNRLAGLAADAEQWDEIQRQLSSGATDPDAEYLGAHQRWKRPAAWNDAMAKTLLSPASHPEMLGRIGRYDVERLIGSGGMGVVFKAYDTELNRPVAVKLLAPYLSASGAARNRFAREARAAAAVVDDHVVPIHNVETDDEHPFLVMKYIGGGSLQRRLDREGPLEVCEVLRIGMQTAKGLAAAHAQGLIHRDVKPSNILLDEGVDRALLTDFGLARATDDANLTRSGFHPGTPHYMSPEQVRGEAIDDRSDLFGLGCVLYGLCTGHPPFRSETSYAVLRRITDDTPRPIRETNPDIPTWLEQIVMKLLAKSADDRYESADQVAELLEDCLAHVQQPTTTPLPESLRTTNDASFLSKVARHLRFSATSTAKRGRSDAVAAGRGSTPSSAGFRYPPIGKFVAAAIFGFFLILAGVTIVLELNKGTLTIESDVDDVPIRIMQGETIYKKLNVSQKANTVRIAAGKYVVEVDGDFTDMSVVDGVVSLQRGKTETVRIVKSDGRKAADAAQAGLVRPGSEQSKIQIWGPTTLDSHTVASDPPSVDEIMQALEKARPADNGIPMLTEKQRSNVRIIKEKIADFVDPPRFYPNVGRAKVHHVHYKCTIRFDETTKISYPIPHTLKAGDAFEVVYIDHTHFHMVNEPANAKSENSDVDFAKLSKLRDRLHEADRVVNQIRESVQRWEERLELRKNPPSDKVNGPFDIPDTGSIEDAKQSLASQNVQLQRYIRDREFLHREVVSQFVILRKQYDVALGAGALAEKEAKAYEKLYQESAITELERNSKQHAASKAKLASAELAELVQQCSSLIEEFGIKETQSMKRALAATNTTSKSQNCTRTYSVGSYVSDAMFGGLKKNVMPATDSSEVKDAIKVAADNLIEVIESTCGPCRSIHFMPAGMELVVQHTVEGQDDILELLETMRANDPGRINIKLFGASDGLIPDEAEEQFEKWSERSSKLTAEEVLKLESWMTLGGDNSIAKTTLIPGKPAIVRVMNFPMTVVARHVRESNKVQIRLDYNDIPMSLSGTIELDGSGLVLNTTNPEYFFWLAVPSLAAPDVEAGAPKGIHQDKTAADLIGSWRAMEFQDADMEELEENIVLTFDEWTMTWLTEPDESSKSIYRILPNNTLLFVSDAETAAGKTNIETKYRYTFRDPNHLELEMYGGDGKLTKNSILLERIADASNLSTYVSQLIPVDTDETYGYAEHAFVDTRKQLIESEKLLSSVKWPEEIDLIPAGKNEALRWLRRYLDAKVTEDNEIEIGMHGHIRTMKQREQIVATIADAYHNKIAEMNTKASQEVIQLLRTAHADVVKQRETATHQHQQLLLNDPADPNELAKSKAKLVRLNDLLTELCEKLTELGVPVITGSTELSIDSASVGAQVQYNRLRNSASVSLPRSLRYSRQGTPDKTPQKIQLELGDELPPNTHLCKFTPSGDYIFWGVRSQLWVFRTKDGKILRKIDLQRPDLETNHPDARAFAAEGDNCERIAFAFGGKKLVVSEPLYWRSPRNVHRTKTSPMFAIYDVDDIVNGKKLQPTLVNVPQPDATKESFRPYRFVCSVGDHRLVFVYHVRAKDRWTERLIVYDTNRGEFDPASEVDLGCDSVFLNDDWRGNNGFRLSDKATCVLGEVPERNVLVALRGRNDWLHDESDDERSLVLEKLNIQWDDQGIGSMREVDRTVLKTPPLALSPDAQRYIYQARNESMKVLDDIMVAAMSEDAQATKMRSLLTTDTNSQNVGLWTDDARLFFSNDKNRSKKKRQTWVAVCDRDGIHINQIQTGQAHDAYVVAVSPNGRFAVTNAMTMLELPKDPPVNKYVGNLVTLWDLKSMKIKPGSYDAKNAGEIMVELHCGDDFIFSFLDVAWEERKMLDGLILKLRENHGVNYQFRSTGPGDVLSKVVVRDPARRCDRDAKLRSRIEAAIQSAGLSENTRWDNAKAPAANEDDISVNINCGTEFLMPYSDVKWRSHEAKADIKINQLFFQLNMIEGIDARYRITGPGNDVSVVVNDPAQRSKREPKLKSKIESILKSTGVQSKTKWAANSNENAVQDAKDISKGVGKSKSPAVAVPPMEFDSLEDFLKPGKDLFEKEMKQIDQRLATAKEGTAEHTLFTTKKKQLQEHWELSVAQVKGMVAAAESGHPVQLAPIVIPSNATPWKAPLPDPLQSHDEDIAKVLAGTWEIIKPASFLMDGEKNEVETFSATFSKNMLITKLTIGDLENETQYIYRISGDKIDLWSYDPDESQTDRLHPMLGSFSLKDDTLRISHHEREMEIGQPQPRPPIKPGKGLVYWEMKRRTP